VVVSIFKTEKYTMQNLDSTDKILIEELQKDSKQSIKQLAQKVNLSITPTHERIKRLEANGIIEKYVAIVNPTLLGRNLMVYCHVTLVKHQEAYFKEFEAFVAGIDEIVEVMYLAGPYDYIIKVVLKDMADFEHFIARKISRLEIISNIQSSFVITQVKKFTKISTE